MLRLLACCVLVAMLTGGAAADWRLPKTHEQQLPDSIDCWEPALAVGPAGEVYVSAGRRNAPLRSPNYDQRQVVWRSDDRGVTFKPPKPVSSDGSKHYDQRIAVDRRGTVYLSYLDTLRTPNGRPQSRLRLAISRDRGDTFSATTVTTDHVSDKPELAVSADGTHLYIVYTSVPGPAFVASHDGGATWEAPHPVVANEGRHFWPESLAVAGDGSLWFAVPSMSDDDIANRKDTKVTLHVFRSTDRGRTWHDTDLGGSTRILKGCVHDPDCPVKVNSLGVAVDAAGRAYAAYTAGADRQPFSLFVRSTLDGLDWSAPSTISAAPRPESHDTADYDNAMIAASVSGTVCVAWVDDRRGLLDVFARCSTDGGGTWGSEYLLSDRSDGAPYKTPAGFKDFYGHYGGLAIDAGSRLHVAWAAGEPGYRTGSVWVNSIDIK